MCQLVFPTTSVRGNYLGITIPNAKFDSNGNPEHGKNVLKNRVCNFIKYRMKILVINVCIDLHSLMRHVG